MAWYSTGTVAVTLNSPTVTGTGTAFPPTPGSAMHFADPMGVGTRSQTSPVRR